MPNYWGDDSRNIALVMEIRTSKRSGCHFQKVKPLSVILTYIGSPFNATSLSTVKQCLLMCRDYRDTTDFFLFFLLSHHLWWGRLFSDIVVFIQTPIRNLIKFTGSLCGKILCTLCKYMSL